MDVSERSFAPLQARSPRIVLGHAFTGTGAFSQQWIESWLSRLRARGIDVRGALLGVDVPGKRLAWPELDARWRRGDRELLSLYERIAREVDGADALINYGGLNLHPDFLRQLSCVSALAFFDDPESSDEYSRPVAPAHDVCLVGNVACLDDYVRWGARLVRWWPHGFRADEYDDSLDEEGIRRGNRDVDVALLCERLTHYRREKVDQFALAFPQGIYRGPGWPAGFLPEPERVPLLQRTRIGINIHNSTGPINFRTFYLPANGVMQICDNKAHLARVFDVGTEAIGYDDIRDAIDMCRYYLEHESERIEIAVAGWRRALRDYNEVAAFSHVVRAVQEVQAARSPARAPDVAVVLRRQAQATRSRRLVHRLTLPLLWPASQARRIARGALRRLSWALDTWRYRRASRLQSR